MSPAIQTYSDTEFAHLTAQLAKVTAERDRAREIAVALEQRLAAVEDALPKCYAFGQIGAAFVATCLDITDERWDEAMRCLPCQVRAALDGAA